MKSGAVEKRGMASGGGDYRKERRSSGAHRQNHHQNWTLTPILDSHVPNGQTSASASTPQDHKLPQNSLKLSWEPKDRGKKSRSARNYQKQVAASSSKVEPDSDSNFGGVNGNEEGSESGLGAGLEISSDTGEIQGNQEDEGMKSNCEVDEDKIVERLKELRLSAQEPELPEELVSINNQLQEDELLAVASIFGDNILLLEDKSGLKCLQAHIHVEVPKGLRVTAKLDLSTFHEKSSEDSSDFSYSFEVEYLPPIILTCLLPKSYPNKHSPYFTISVQWLGSDKISELCCKLDSIWEEQAGQEVIYQWLEWLHSCTLSYLGFDAEIVLGPYGARPNEDRRAISGSVSSDIDIPKIKTYNDEERHENFCRNIQECCICFNEFVGSEFIRLPCQHFFCANCLKTLFDIHIGEGTVLKLQCPEAKCGGMIPPGLLGRLLSEAEFEQWESLMLEKTLESMSDVVYCPRCETACLEDEDDHAQCSKCYYNFCTLCRERRHVGVQCMTPEMKLVILQERQNSTSLKGDQRRREEDMINQILSMREINSFAKQCPSCKMAISRSEGCNKMVCNNCGMYFCYRCNQAISGYEHFRDGKCELFPTEEIQRWEERMNGREIVGQIQAEIVAVLGHSCPNCGQHNVKMGNNNHIFCWACQNHYCYLCKQMVRRSSQHYGPKGCKQHTIG